MRLPVATYFTLCAIPFKFFVLSWILSEWGGSTSKVNFFLQIFFGTEVREITSLISPIEWAMSKYVSSSSCMHYQLWVFRHASGPSHLWQLMGQIWMAPPTTLTYWRNLFQLVHGLLFAENTILPSDHLDIGRMRIEMERQAPSTLRKKPRYVEMNEQDVNMTQ